MNKELRTELESLTKKHKDQLNADILYEAAKQRKNYPALWNYCNDHQCWDKTAASEMWTKNVLGQLYRKWSVVITNTKQERIWKPMVVKNPAKAGNEPGMVKTASLKGRPDLQKRVILDYVKKARGFLRTGQAVAKDLNAMEYFDSVLESLEVLMQQIENHGKRAKAASTAIQPDSRH